MLDAVPLDDDVVPDHVDVHEAAMNPPMFFSSDEHQEIMPVLPIEYGLRFHVAMRVRDCGVLGKSALDYLSIGDSGVHDRILSISTS